MQLKLDIAMLEKIAIFIAKWKFNCNYNCHFGGNCKLNCNFRQSLQFIAIF